MDTPNKRPTSGSNRTQTAAKKKRKPEAIGSFILAVVMLFLLSREAPPADTGDDYLANAGSSSSEQSSQSTLGSSSGEENSQSTPGSSSGEQPSQSTPGSSSGEQPSQSTPGSSSGEQPSQSVTPPATDPPKTELLQIKVPNVLNQTQSAAEAELVKLGFVVEFQYNKYNDIAENRVAEQTPKSGEQLAAGSTIVLKISSGKPTISVGSAVGKTRSEAESLLKSQGFRVSVQEAYHNSVAAGIVISQSPSAGSGQVANTTIVLTVSKGPKPVTLTFDPKGGSASKASQTVYCGQAFGTLPTAQRTGFTFAGWYFSSGEKLSSGTTVANADTLYAYAKWTPNAYSVKWNEATGCNIKVERTSSPNQGASTGTLSNGATVYYGDNLKITYNAKTGYELNAKGSTAITVTGNVTASHIYATAISIPASIVKSGYISNYTSYKLAYSANIEYRNRTATSVQIRITWTATLSGSGVYNSYGQRFSANVGSVNTGEVILSNYGTWTSSSSSPRSVTNASDWITVPLSTVKATTVSLNVNYYQTNYPGTNMTKHYGVDGLTATWTINIPAY